MMKSLFYERFAKYAILRTIFLGGMGMALLLYPEFLLNGMFYAIVGYVLLDGALRIVDFVREKESKSLLSYGSLALAILLFLVGFHSIAYARYLIQVSPVYLGTLLLFESIAYFIVAMCAAKSWQKTILAILSVMAFLGGLAVFIFTFGFGIGGIPELIYISGVASLISCAYVLVSYIIYRKTKDTRELEETT